MIPKAPTKILKAVPETIFDNEMDTIHTKMCYLAGWKDGTEKQCDDDHDYYSELIEQEKAKIFKDMEEMDLLAEHDHTQGVGVVACPRCTYEAYQQGRRKLKTIPELVEQARIEERKWIGEWLEAYRINWDKPIGVRYNGILPKSVEELKSGKRPKGELSIKTEPFCGIADGDEED